MPLESLLQLVETLRERIDSHRDALRQSEALTRYALIDPLLREMGWDTEDPGMVVPEYRSGSGSADYALIGNGRPVMMVEAKKLGTPLRDQVLAQGINYCLMEGTNHFAVTDGSNWEIYETHRPVPIDQKRVVEFNLTGSSAAETCLKALALWRPSVQSGTVVGGDSPLLTTPAQKVDSSTVSPSAPATKTTPSISDHDQALDQHRWQRLSDISWAKGHPKPVEIQFPDGSDVSIKAWNGLMIEPVRWLTNVNSLTSNQCPIQQSTRYLVSTDQTHPRGNPMTSPVRVNSFYVETNYSALHCVRNAKTIIKHVGQDPAEFKVRFS